MAIVSVRRMFDGRGASKDFKTRIVYNNTYEVVTDSAADDEQTVAGDNAIDPQTGVKVPVHGDTYPGNAYAVVTDVNPEQSSDSLYIWYVSIKYDTKPDTPAVNDMSGENGGAGGTGDRPGTFEPDPLNRPATWRLDSIDRQQIVREWLRVKDNGQFKFYIPVQWFAGVYNNGAYVRNNGLVYKAVQEGKGTSATGPAGKGDANGEQTDGTVVWYYIATNAQVTTDPRYAILEACANSARIPFDPPEMTDVSIPTIVVTKNLPMITMLYSYQIKNAVNLYTWKGLPPRVAKVMKFTAGNKTENGSSFVEGTWEIGLDPDTWDSRIFDCGFGGFETREVQNPNAPPDRVQKKMFVRFRDPGGEDISAAVPMDGGGSRLNPDDMPVFLRGLPKQMKLLDFNELIPF